MIVKKIHSDGQSKLRSGIDKLANAVVSTMGPLGRTVLLESEQVVGGITVTKDGVTVARSINLYDPVENIACVIMKQAAENTAKYAGDGTTNSICLARAILRSADSYMTPENNVHDVIRHINDISSELVNILKKNRKRMSNKHRLSVATISANNDPKIGKKIADLYGKTKYVTVENSMTTETTTRVINGIKVDRGWSSIHFINNHRTNQCILENPYILICDQKIESIREIEKIIMHCASPNDPSKKRPLLIISELSETAAGTLRLNAQKNVFPICNIIPPSFGMKKDEILTDLAVAVGATYYSSKTGDTITSVSPDGLGSASRIVVSQDETIIFANGSTNDAINARVNDLTDQLKKEKNKSNIEFLEERIANICGNIGIISVGADTDIEQKELKDRIDDAVLAVRSAIEEGITSGGGVGLINAISDYKAQYNDNEINFQTALLTMITAVEEPYRQICRNAGIDHKDYIDQIVENRGIGLNIKTKEVGNMIDMGITDPVKVVRMSLMNAVSVATTLLSTSEVITNIRENESVE